MSKHPSQSDIDEGLYRNSDMPLITDTTTDSVATNLRKAAVLIPLVREHGEWHILFIRRADNKRDRHSGQVAFPGGAMEVADNHSALATALRETFEEIGVADDLIQPIQELQAYITISNYRVMPVVGVISWPTKLTLQKEEVSRTFTIPLSWLRDGNNFALRPRCEVEKNTTNTDNPARPHPIVVYKEYDDEVLWGATARMTLNFLQALDDGDLKLPSAK
ncbi:MAG: CoA pyrophosphatase [Granulosicoccaceae bacterium]